MKQNIKVNTISAGLVAVILGGTGPELIIINGGTNGGTYAETISWLFTVDFFGGLLGILLALKYRQPISGACIIAGAILVTGALIHFSINEAIGAYLVVHIYHSSWFVRLNRQSHEVDTGSDCDGDDCWSHESVLQQK